MSFELKTDSDQIAQRREKIEIEINEFKNKVTEKFSETDAKKIHEALEFMLKIHLPQKDRVDGKPFASHPLAVAEKVMAMSNDPELVIAALNHDSVEDQSDRIFVERINRKNIGGNLHLNINEATKEKYKTIFTAWSFKEIEELFGPKVKYYVENMTNHDFNSLADSLDLSKDERENFVNKLYAEHVENIINDPKLFTLKLADLSTNIDLHSLDPEGEKYKTLKRKYKSVIEAIIEKLQNIPTDHLIYEKKGEITKELEQVYQEQYSK
jgi:(p)ppGpp synthase/HD superfamily hydrolase